MFQKNVVPLRAQRFLKPIMSLTDIKSKEKRMCALSEKKHTANDLES